MIKLTENILTKTIKKRPVDSYKGSYGKVVLIGGNRNFGGAIIMATLAAVSAGAGLVTTITDNTNQSSLHNWVPEAMFADITDFTSTTALIKSATVIVIGPGLGTTNHSLAVLNLILKIVNSNQTLVIDGSALTLIAQHHISLPKSSKVILTPHQMEWQRLSGISINDQTNSELNQQVVQQLAATVVLKSAHTQIYTNQQVYQNTSGTPAQATGGMGDTLAGMIGGFCAQFNNQTNATLAAVYAHSAIADELGQQQYVVLPHQISQKLPNFMKQYEN
ncbi:NAD(P)H-hydrate dehydratase [Lentilactobacillus kribbianus]|uniref:NAD(P)H-hydrate dehydratase n=1 Tax=Lentilactobacillus kribbianus TaxID=2729622 RepID=UPI0015521F9A|nr:NAD(P)H-hydrate dehydratase [Lentilactobacillus kribbianus]